VAPATINKAAGGVRKHNGRSQDGVDFICAIITKQICC